MPGAASIATRSSREIVLSASAVEPVRNTIARSSRAAFDIAFCSPVAIASTVVSTATTPAIPTQITSDVPIRCGMLRRLMPVMASVCLIEFMTSPHRPDSVSLMVEPARAPPEWSH